MEGIRTRPVLNLDSEENLVLLSDLNAIVLEENVIKRFETTLGNFSRLPGKPEAHKILSLSLGESLSEFPLIQMSGIGFYNEKMYFIDSSWREIFVVDSKNGVSVIPTLIGRRYTNFKFPAVFHSDGKMRFHKKYKVFINGIGRLNWFDPEVGCNPYLTEAKHRDFTIGNDAHVYVVSERGLGRIKLPAEMFKKKQ